MSNATNAHLWRLDGTVLTPTTAHLQAYTITLLNHALPDQILTFHFPNHSSTLTFHKSYLTNASPALNALVNSPFLEATSHTINLRYETYHTFHIIRDFIYLNPIDLTKAPQDLPLVADRWGLGDLFRAYLTFVRSYEWPSINAFINACLPVLQLPRLPLHFKRSFAIKLAKNIHQVQSWIHQCDPSCTSHASTRDSATCQQARFRESVLWQALHKQRIIPRFIKYLKFYHHNNSYNYLAFVTNGMHHVLKGFVTKRDVTRIMSKGIFTYVPRMLSGTSRDLPKPRIGTDKNITSQIYVVNVLKELVFPLLMYVFPLRQALNVDAMAFQALLMAPVKSISDGSEEDAHKSIYQTDYGD